jgi:hypothetical protein
MILPANRSETEAHAVCCVLKGMAVLGALILVGFAPAWYRLTHIH